MEEVLKRQGASWINTGRLVLIPANFGVEPSDLEGLLNAELLRKVEEIGEELETTRDELGEYTCPHCGAGLSSAGSVELDEHNDGYYRAFECGYAAMDGHPEKLCPSDPKFPKLEDFELELQQNKYGEWICHARPKTSLARKVDLWSEPGRTEDEARQRVIERYKYIARKRERR